MSAAASKQHSGAVSMLSHARRYVEAFGLLIVPIIPGTKRPATEHGWKSASHDLSPWRKNPRLGIGLPLQPNSLFAVDEDEDGARFDLGVDLPETWTRYGRPGRRTLIYRVPSGHEPRLEGLGGRLQILWKHQTVIPPTIHPDLGAPFRWDDKLQPGESAIGTATPAMLRQVGEQRVYEYDGEGIDTFLGAAFHAAGMVIGPVGGGKLAVRCPWTHEHSSLGTASSTVVLPARKGGLRVGGFRCMHGHCEDRRTKDVVAWMSVEALQRAAVTYREELDAVAHILARLRNG